MGATTGIAMYTATVNPTYLYVESTIPAPNANAITEHISCFAVSPITIDSLYFSISLFIEMFILSPLYNPSILLVKLCAPFTEPTVIATLNVNSHIYISAFVQSA